MAPGARLRAVPLLARATGLLGDVPTDGWRRVDLGGAVAGDLWSPRRRSGPPVLLAVGVTPDGPADPRVRRLAGALARAGRTVFVPELALADRELTELDVDRLVAAFRALDAGQGVVAVGFSFGGSYSLIAAADPRAAPHVRAVASFGAYAELLGYLSAMRSRLRDADAVAALADGLGVEARERDRVIAVLDGRAGVDELPDHLRDLAGRLSPVSYAGAIDAPVVLLHASGDETVPDRELWLLADAFPHANVHTVELFTHVDLRARPRQVLQLVGDLRTVWRFAVAVLRA